MDLDKALQSCDQCIATNDSQQMLTTFSSTDLLWSPSTCILRAI